MVAPPRPGLGNFMAAAIPALNQQRMTNMLSGLPRRKPDVATILAMRGVRDSLENTDFLERLRHSPIEALGRGGAKIFPIAAGDIARGNSVSRGVYYPMEPSPLVKKEIKRTGFQGQGFDSDLIALSASAIPEDASPAEVATIMHEFRHRGLRILRDRGYGIDNILKAFKVKFGFGLGEEDFVRLSGVLSGVEDKESVKDYYKQLRGISKKKVDELLNNPEVQMFVMLIQKASADAIREELYKPNERVTDINLPSMELMSRQTRIPLIFNAAEFLTPNFGRGRGAQK